jgi:CubicO group peptidase (beta-lactamase class C family)
MQNTQFKRHHISWCILVVSIYGFFTTPLIASTDYWPTNGWRSSTPEEQGMDSGKLIEMLELVRGMDYAIDSITIVRNGYLVMDAYLYPFQKNTKHPIYSVTKSFTSTLIGIALDKGYIKSINQPVLEFFPEKTIASLDQQKRAITLEHLLTMSSGLDTKDSWKYQWIGLSKMWASKDWAQYVLDLPVAQTPGENFEYSNGVSFLLTAILQQSTGMRPLEFAEKHLFGPMGISDVKWPISRQGINTGYGEMRLTPHDMAKFGLLYLNKGRWENKRIVSEAWVKAATRKHISANIFDGYGYQWWVSPIRNHSSQYYMAVGYLGQFIFVLPEKNLVVVFTSNNLREGNFDTPKRLVDRYINPAAVSFNPLAAQPKENEQLDSLVAKFAEAPVQQIIWTSEENGVAKNGVFVHTASPAFRFKYPSTSYKRSLDYPGAVMVMNTYGENEFLASTYEISADTKLANFGREIAIDLNKIGSEIQVISNKKITLQDGTAAYRTDVSWKFQSSWLTRSLFVTAIKEGKAVIVEYHFTFTPWDEASTTENLKEGTYIVESLTFK